MEIFDKKFVRFMWGDELEGKKCFVSDSIDILINAVNKEILNTAVINRSKGGGYVLHSNETGNDYTFAYYDPNYEVEKAFNEGKTIQVQISESYWKDISSEPDLLFVCDKGGILRIKPENEKSWIVYFNREIELNGKDGYLTACREDKWGDAQEDYGAKTKLFIGSESEVEEWYKARQKFAEVIKAWEDGKQIQVTPKGTDKWIDLHFEPTWDLRDEYRVKPEEEKKQYRPYESSAEMIADFIDRFKVNCPPYAEPLVWVKSKKTGYCYLITTFYATSVLISAGATTVSSIWELFECYTYLDGSPVGMEAKE